MLKDVIRHFANQLQLYLEKKYPQAEGVTKVAPLGKETKSEMNKLVVSLVSIERETAGGVVPTRSHQGNVTNVGNPPLYMNVNLVMAAVFNEDKYEEGLSVLSDTLLFIQSYTFFKYKDITYTLEVVSPNSQELNNIWSTLGGQYYPSVLCKLRRIAFDSHDLQNVIGNIESIEVGVQS